MNDKLYEKGRTWDVQLALGLLEATAGTSLMGEFWDQYTNIIQACKLKHNSHQSFDLRSVY